jgi:hypothetical protein
MNANVRAEREKQTEAKEECRKLEKDMDQFKNNKEGKVGVLTVRSFVPCLPLFWSELRIRSSAILGGHYEAEGRAAETYHHRQDPAEGGADCYPRAWFVSPLPYLI